MIITRGPVKLPVGELDTNVARFGGHRAPRSFIKMFSRSRIFVAAARGHFTEILMSSRLRHHPVLACLKYLRYWSWSLVKSTLLTLMVRERSDGMRRISTA